MTDYKWLLLHDGQAVLDLIIQGDERAFTAIYDEYSVQLYRNILRMVADEDIAKELLQDLFLKLWTNRERLTTTKSLKPYLYRMAANLVYDHFRKVAQDRKLLDRLIYLTVEYDISAEDRMLNEETETLLKDAIEHLPPQRKLVYTLCKLEGKSYQEVSELLNISVATINEHIVKGNKAVKVYFLRRHEIAIALIAVWLAHHQ